MGLWTGQRPTSIQTSVLSSSFCRFAQHSTDNDCAFKNEIQPSMLLLLLLLPEIYYRKNLQFNQCDLSSFSDPNHTVINIDRSADLDIYMLGNPRLRQVI